jgi:prepilin peptidase CpaA
VAVLLTVLQYLAFILFPLTVAYAAATDLLTNTISNKLSLGLVAGFVLLAPMTGMDWQTFGLHWAAGGLVLVVFFVCFALGWMGGGDVKLAAAIALWLGLDQILAFAVWTAIYGGLLTLGILSFRRLPVLPAFAVRQPWIQRLYEPKAGVPYGVALAAAGVAIYPQTIWLGVATG